MVFSKISASIKSDFFSGGSFPSFCFSKIGSGLCFKKFRVKSAQASEIGFNVLVKVLASKRFHFAKSVFHGLRFVWQNQVSEIGYNFFNKSFGMFGSGFFVRFIFSGKVGFS